jgi:hypothetical protein
MLYTEHTKLTAGKFYYCIGDKIAYITLFADLPKPSDVYTKFSYTDYWTSTSHFVELADSCCYEDIADMQHYLLPDVNSPEDVAHYIKSHPELAL